MKEHERWSEEIERERGREEAGGEREVVGGWGMGEAALGQENMSRCSRENECYKQAQVLVIYH